VRLFPPLANRFLAYGSRTATDQPSNSSGKSVGKDRDTARIQESNILDKFANLRVPHGWFASFYVFSVLASCFWAPQILFSFGLVPYITTSCSQAGSSMTLQQVMVAWALMLVQGARRLYECLAFTKPSSSQMWIGHWAVGVWFYATMSVAVWIEGSRKSDFSFCCQLHSLTVL